MTRGKERFALVGVLIVLLLINFVCALTGSIGNAKMILYPEVNGWFTTTIEKSILVKNVNDEEVEINLETDQEGEEFLELIDKSFTLQPNTEKKAEFLVKVRKEGTYEGRINVFFSPVEGKSPGVVLSSTIIVIAKKDTDYEEAEEEEDQEDQEDNETGSVNVITGGAIGVDEKNKKSKTPLFLGLSSTFLLIILIILVFLMNKKRSVKRGNKLNAKKKS